MNEEYTHPLETVSSFDDYLEMVGKNIVNNPCRECGEEMSQELVRTFKTTRANEDDKFEYMWLCPNGHTKEIDEGR